MVEQDTIRLLRECDAGVKMGISSIEDVLEYVKSENLEKYLTKCKEEHENLNRELQELLDLPAITITPVVVKEPVLADLVQEEAAEPAAAAVSGADWLVLPRFAWTVPPRPCCEALPQRPSCR